MFCADAIDQFLPHFLFFFYANRTFPRNERVQSMINFNTRTENSASYFGLAPKFNLIYLNVHKIDIFKTFTLN